MKTNPIFAFLSELIIRLKTKNSAFMNVLKYIAFAVALVAGLPEFITYLGVDLPSWAMVFTNKIVGIAATVASILLMFDIDPKAVAQVNSMSLKSTGEAPVKKVILPFTN